MVNKRSHLRLDAGHPPTSVEADSATALKLIRVDDVMPQRWRNGGGWTRELIASPPGPDWRARVSVAEIESDGLFSNFEGAERWFCVLSGGGVELTVDGTTLRVAVGDAPVCFDGGSATECRLLLGPTRNLNLMVRGGHGSMTEVESGCGWVPPPAQCALYAAVDGVCHGTPVSAHSLLWFESAPAQLTFDPISLSRGPLGWWLAMPPEAQLA